MGVRAFAPMAKGDDPSEGDALLAELKARVAQVFSLEDVEAHFEMALAYQELGLHAEALGELGIVELGHGLDALGTARVLLRRAVSREATGDLGGALMDYQRVRAVDPANEPANEGYARLAKLVLLA